MGQHITLCVHRVKCGVNETTSLNVSNLRCGAGIWSYFFQFYTDYWVLTPTPNPKFYRFQLPTLFNSDSDSDSWIFSTPTPTPKLEIKRIRVPSPTPASEHFRLWLWLRKWMFYLSFWLRFLTPTPILEPFRLRLQIWLRLQNRKKTAPPTTGFDFDHQNWVYIIKQCFTSQVNSSLENVPPVISCETLMFSKQLLVPKLYIKYMRYRHIVLY